MKPARIKFLTTEEGGRQAAPTKAAAHYRTNAGPTTDPMDAQWTLVVEFDEQPSHDWTDCKVNYLVYSHPECPPLTPGTKLNMFEGHRLVARVELT